MLKSLSVFFPAYNEESNIGNTVFKAKEILPKIAEKWEIIVVDDGSQDRTSKVVEGLGRTDPRIRIIRHEENKGYGAALQTGFYDAKYDWIAYNDSDGQFDFDEIRRFIDQKDSADLLIGYRIKRKDSFYRLFLAKGWSALLFLFFGLKLKDVDCGFKMIRKKVLKKIPHLESERGGMINAELAIKAKEAGFKIKQVGVNHYPRKSGKATGGSLEVVVKSFVDLFNIWRKLRFG